MDFTNFKFRIATEAEIAQRKRETLSTLVHEEQSEYKVHPIKKADKTHLPIELLSYLKAIKETPGIPATLRDDNLGIPRKQGSSYRTRLKEMGLLESYSASGGARGRNFADYRLTPKADALF
jgi:hypothetical protein